MCSFKSNWIVIYEETVRHTSENILWTHPSLKSSIFWDLTPCIPDKTSREFGGIYRLHFQGLTLGKTWSEHEEGSRQQDSEHGESNMLLEAQFGVKKLSSVPSVLKIPELWTAVSTLVSPENKITFFLPALSFTWLALTVLNRFNIWMQKRH
jgi:hypothetical protein